MKILFTLFSFCLITGFSNLSNNAESGYKIGDIAVDFKLLSTDNKMVTLRDFPKANGYIIIFTSNICPYAKMYEKRIIQLHHNYYSMGYPLIVINSNDASIQPDDSFEEMVKISGEKKYPFPYLFDEFQEVSLKYGAERSPQAFLLDRNKRVQYIGTIDDNARDESAVNIKYIDSAIAALENGKAPQIAYTKAVGCGIKSKLDRERKQRKMSEDSN